jgi:hypothetical protein
MSRARLIWLAVLLALLGGGWLVVRQVLLRKTPLEPPPLVRIEGRLREIERAKAYWLDGHSSGETRELKPDDLAPYLLRGFWRQTVAGERYAINRQGTAPEAELAQPLEGLPSGTRLRVGPDGQLERIPPPAR